MSVNRVTLIGRMGADVALDPNNKGAVKVARGSIAVSESYKDKSGEWKEVVDWIQVRFYDRLADGAIGKLKKGMEVYMEGKVKTWKFEKDGKTTYATAIKIEKFYVPKGSATAKAAAPETSDAEVPEMVNADDLPF
jgi:single-strand DNA-binding protein